jgi:hypothetical protein
VAACKQDSTIFVLITLKNLVIFQLRLLTSWGDDFYIGLNGIELFNRRDQPIRLRPQNLAAFPESVNCLAAVNGTDPRTSDKLIDGIYDTTKAHHMWLTPILPNSFARVFIIFDTPTFVTRIRVKICRIIIKRRNRKDGN